MDLFGIHRLERRLGRRIDALTRAIHELKELLMDTKQDVINKLSNVESTLTELKKDSARMAEDLRTAVANGNLDDVNAIADRLQSLASGIDADVESASPEPTEPAEPTPADEPQA